MFYKKSSLGENCIVYASYHGYMHASIDLISTHVDEFVCHSN
jgi:hypothetical protein